MQMIAFAIALGVLLHAGLHLTCDFPRLINSSPKTFALIASDFNYKKPTYWDLVKGIEGLTGIGMVVLMAIAFTLATSQFRRNVVKLPTPFNRLAGYNAFWYSHHLLAIVYVLLVVHGFFLFLVKSWTRKTVRPYTIYVPLTKFSINFLICFLVFSDMDVHMRSATALYSRAKPADLQIRDSPS